MRRDENGLREQIGISRRQWISLAVSVALSGMFPFSGSALAQAAKRGGVLKMLTSTRVLWMCDASAI